MFLEKLPDAIDVLTISMMYGAVMSHYTHPDVRSSSYDFGGAACSIDKIS